MIDFRELERIRVDLPEPTLTTTLTVGVHRVSATGNPLLRNLIYTQGDRVYVRPGGPAVDSGTFQFRFTPTIIRSSTCEPVT